jgi:hypothetical protein
MDNKEIQTEQFSKMASWTECNRTQGDMTEYNYRPSCSYNFGQNISLKKLMLPLNILGASLPQEVLQA